MPTYRTWLDDWSNHAPNDPNPRPVVEEVVYDVPEGQDVHLGHHEVGTCPHASHEHARQLQARAHDLGIDGLVFTRIQSRA